MIQYIQSKIKVYCWEVFSN